MRGRCGHTHTAIFTQDASMLPRLVGWARIVCACSALWVVPYTVAAQEGRRPTVAGLEAAILTPFLTLPERPSPQATLTSVQGDQSPPGHSSRLLDAVAWNWERMFI